MTIQIRTELEFPLVTHDSNFWIVKRMIHSKIYTKILYSEHQLSDYCNGFVKDHFFTDCSRIPISTRIEKGYAVSIYNCFSSSDMENGDVLKYLNAHQ